METYLPLLFNIIGENIPLGYTIQHLPEVICSRVPYSALSYTSFDNPNGRTKTNNEFLSKAMEKLLLNRQNYPNLLKAILADYVAS
jgi:hypothetical protein